MNLEEVGKLYTPEKMMETITTREYKEKYVDFEVTMKACRECPNYSKNWACPEFYEDVLENWDRYEHLDLYLTKINFTREALSASYDMDDIEFIINNTLFLERNKLISQLEEEEKARNGKCLSAGFCTVCDECSRITGQPCRYPDKCHNSIESLGGLVSDTLKGVFGEEIKWIDMENGKLPVNLSLLMGLLY